MQTLPFLILKKYGRDGMMRHSNEQSVQLGEDLTRPAGIKNLHSSPLPSPPYLTVGDLMFVGFLENTFLT